MGRRIPYCFHIHEHAWCVLSIQTLPFFVANWAKALVAMRVYAIYGGRKWLKLVLWVGGVLYAIPTLLILGFGLYEGQRTSFPFRDVRRRRLMAV